MYTYICIVVHAYIVFKHAQNYKDNKMNPHITKME